MAMGRMEQGKQPRVERFEDDVAVWAGSGQDDDTIGLVMSAAAAQSSAIKMLRVAAEIIGKDTPVFPVSNAALDTRELDDGETVVRMVFEVEGSELGIYLSLDQFGDVAANFAAIARTLDRVERPRPDR